MQSFAFVLKVFITNIFAQRKRFLEKPERLFSCSAILIRIEPAAAMCRKLPPQWNDRVTLTWHDPYSCQNSDCETLGTREPTKVYMRGPKL